MSSVSAETASPRVHGLATLSAAAFCSAATLRAADPLIPQVSEEFAVSISDAAIIATAFTFAYGAFQIVYGTFGDRVGKLTVIAIASLLAALSAFASALAPGLPMLAVLRLIGGGTAGAIIPLAIAYIGDVTPYHQRQGVLARFLSGQILGIIMGQALGGILGEHIGWRGVFAVFGVFFLTVAAVLGRDVLSGRVPQKRMPPAGNVLQQYRILLRTPRAVGLIAAVFAEGFLFFGGLTFIGAHLRQAYGLSLDSIGLLLGCFGLGGLGYILFAQRLVRRLGERRMMLTGGTIMAIAFVIIGLGPPVWVFTVILAACGVGFYLMHGTLQTNATQIAPHARALGLSMFATCLFVGQALGVTSVGQAMMAIGFAPTILGAGVLLAALGVILAWRLKPPG
jgi:MFS transporter, YNFM family, putative membrane transport protein